MGVQVREGPQPDRRIVGVERLVVVLEVLPVLARLHGWVEDVVWLLQVAAARPEALLEVVRKG